jgi:hypothetical protein
MENNKVFHNLTILEAARQTVVEQLGPKYAEKVQPFVNVILMIMKANETDKFTAMKIIKDKLAIYNQENAPLYFSAALMEIVEETDLKNFKK